MKKLHLSLIIGLLLCCLCLFVGCSKNQLSTPSNLQFDEASQTLSWDKVKDANFYTVYITGDAEEERDTSRTYMDLSNLPEGNYQITIQACGRGEDVQNSKYSVKFDFYREKEPNMKFTLINNNTEYQVISKDSKTDETGVFIIPDTYRGKPVTAIGEKAFFNKADVKTVVIGKNVKKIGTQAFANCTNLTSLTLPDTLVSIQDRAFQGCRQLAGDLVIPDSVTELGAYAFSGCEKIASVQIGSGIGKIPSNAFASCRSITVVNIPATITEIEEFAFSDNTALVTLNLGSNVKILGKGAFAYNTALVEVVLPDSVVQIGDGTFLNCSALSQVQLGEGICRIEREAFKYTKIWNDTPVGSPVFVDNWLVGFNITTEDGKEDFNLVTQLVVPDTIVGIADYAVQRFGQIKDVILPNSVKIIGEGAFNASGVVNVVIGEGVESIGTVAFGYAIYLDTVILGGYDWDESSMTKSSLKTIGDNAFIGCEKLSKIEIPETVESIGSYAFRKTAMWQNATDGLVYAGNWLVDCNNERINQDYIEILDGTRGIAKYAFYECSKVYEVALPESVKLIGSSAFYKCRSLLMVYLPSTLERIEDYTFYKCENLLPLELPKSLKYIGRSAFYDCNLGNIRLDTETDTLIIPDSVEYIGEYAFYNCGYSQDNGDTGIVLTGGIDRLILGSGVKTIGANAFSGFISLKSVMIGSSLTVIPERAFYKCTNLTEVVFGSSVETIGERAFYQCTALKEVVLTDAIKTIERNAFYKCTALEKVDLNKAEEVGEYAFYGCAALKGIAFPETVKTIGKQAFRNCTALGGVALPEGITLGDHAFYGCSNMTVFAEAEEREEGWSKRWNSTYRPVVWNCTLSEDGTYMVSFTKAEDSITDKNNSNQLSTPVRDGYECTGWAFDPESEVPEYATEELMDVPNGTVLYAIWVPITPEN